MHDSFRKWQRIEGINPADLTRQINAIQMQLLDLAKAKTEVLAAAHHHQGRSHGRTPGQQARTFT